MYVEQLARDWLTAKRKEQDAIAERLDIEQSILKAYPAKEEGSSSTMLGNGVKIKTTGKLNYKADIDKLLALTASWPADAKPIKTKLEADETLLKRIRSERPDLWKKIAAAITVKSAKTYIEIEEPTNGI